MMTDPCKWPRPHPAGYTAMLRTWETWRGGAAAARTHILCAHVVSVWGCVCGSARVCTGARGVWRCVNLDWFIRDQVGKGVSWKMEFKDTIIWVPVKSLSVRDFFENLCYAKLVRMSQKLLSSPQRSPPRGFGSRLAPEPMRTGHSQGGMECRPAA